jgi:hypothetical protein
LFLIAPGHSYISEIHLEYAITKLKALKPALRSSVVVASGKSCPPRVHLIVYVPNFTQPTTSSGSLPHPVADIQYPTGSISKEAAIVRILTTGCPNKSLVIFPRLFIQRPFPWFISSVESQFSFSGNTAGFQGAVASADGQRALNQHDGNQGIPSPALRFVL